MIKYYLQSWNNKTRKYQTLSTFRKHQFEFAEKLFNKSYNRRHTTRLLKIETQILQQRRGDRRA